MAKVGLIVAAVLMLAAGGTLEVLRSGSRVDAATVERVRDDFTRVPVTVGDWTGREIDYNTKLLARAEAQAYLARRYTQAFTDEVIDVLILAGNPRALGAHDPTVCFAGVGYKQEANEQRRSVRPDPGGRTEQFWVAKFKTDDVPPATVELYWAWGTEGNWSASSNPRLEYASDPLIFKIYVSRPLQQMGRTGDRELTEKFLAEFLPAFRKAVKPADP